MKNSKVFVFLLAAVMVLSSFSMAFGLESATEAQSAGVITTAVTESTAATFSDMGGHWASAAVEKWAAAGVLKGSDGKFRPNAPITRAEMATMLNNMMGYQVAANNTFSDVPAGAWYADAVLKANASGILNGDGAGHASPTANITREQAALMLARAFAVSEGDKTGTKFADAAKISSWAAPMVYGMEAAGYINGYQGNFNPKNTITRAEVATIINNTVKAYYTTAGTYSDKVDGLAIVKASGTILKDAAIAGNLIIAEAVGDGHVTLDGKTSVGGKLVVRGGGENSVIITKDVNVKSILVEKFGGKVRIFADGVLIQEVDAEEDVILEGNFTTVTVGDGAKVVIKGAVSTLNLGEDAAADLPSGSTVATANLKDNSSITGTGKITTANISGVGAVVAQTPTTVNIADDAAATVGGKAIQGKLFDGTVPGGAAATGGGGGGGGGGTAAVPTPSMSITSVTVNGTEIAKNGNAYTVPAEASTDNTAIDVNITNTGDYNYDATISIEKIENDKAIKEVAYAESKGIAGKYIDILNLYGSVTFDDLGKMFDKLGSSHAGWYTDATGTQITGSDKKAFSDSIGAMFAQFTKSGGEYQVTVTLTPAGGSTATLVFKINTGN